MRANALAGMCLILCPAAGLAAEPVYFHKAGVDRDTFATEYGECDELAGGVRVARMNTYSPNMYAAAAGAFFAPFFEGAERRQKTSNILRTCMADKGYRRVEIAPQLNKELKALEQKQRVDRLFDLAATPEPAGKVQPK